MRAGRAGASHSENAPERSDGNIDALAAQFELTPGQIDAAIESAEEKTPQGLWQASRLQARPAFGELARRIEPSATWDDLVLPPAQTGVLKQIAMHVCQRLRVYEDWGFGANQRGLGITALFAGVSGTGKTMAGEVLATDLQLDLYRIDLSQVVSKYIGETEKNLGVVFDAADAGSVILLFDEADALFGKRSEVKDSHDRYANVEISYLLQRMEEYRGLAILTTNQRAALDNAFLRRLRFVIEFPFPDAAARAEIWRRAFPATTPVEGLDSTKLARLNVAGGNIRNIAMNAAFLAADGGRSVRMSDSAAGRANGTGKDGQGANRRRSSRLGEMKIEFVIDELVLHGFDPLQRYAIADLVERELSRLARAHAKDLVRHRPTDVARLDAGSFETPARFRRRTPASGSRTVSSMQYEGDVVKKGYQRPLARTPKSVLPVNEPGDRFEHEADRVADAVVRGESAGAPIAGSPGSAVQRTVDADASVAFAPDLVADVLHGSGQPLDGSTRSTMEDRLGFDFSRVRIHTDAQAAERARSPGPAHTVGSDVVFGAGQYAPRSLEGQRLIAHELTHAYGSNRRRRCCGGGTSSTRSPAGSPGTASITRP